jgi:hypothetical protein
MRCDPTRELKDNPSSIAGTATELPSLSASGRMPCSPIASGWSAMSLPGRDSSRGPFTVSWLLVASLVLVVGASPANAARPVKDAHYYGFDGRLGDVNTAKPNARFFNLSAKLRVSRTGRRVSGRGDGFYIRYGFACRRGRDYVSGTFPLAGRGMPGPPIRRGGGFALAKSRGDARLRLRGRFVSREAATLVYRVSIVPAPSTNGRRPGRCRSGPTRVALFRDGEPPFSDCRSQRATKLISGATGRLFVQYRLTSQGFMPYVFGCLFDTDRRFALGQSYDDQQVALPRLVGPFAAWAVEGCPAGPCTGSIQVRNLRTGAFAHRAIFPGSPLNPYFSLFTDLELKENASFAWIATHWAQPGSAQERLGTEVWALDGLGRRILDTGPDINPGSLRLEGSTLTWENDGVERSAALH